ncbi:hypothetical protein K050079A111_29620 [Bilophila wadsworthia]
MWDGGYTSVRVGAGNGRMPIGGMEVRRTVFQGGAAKGEAVPPHGRQAFKGDLYLIIEGTVPNRLPGTR